MPEKFQEFKAQLKYIPRTLRLIRQATGWWTGSWAMLLLVQGLLPAATVYLTRLLVDSLVAAINSGGEWAQIEPVLIWGGLMGGTIILTELLSSVTGWVRATQAELVQDFLSRRVHEKSTSVDLGFYESWEFFDHLHRARDQAGTRSLSLLESGGSLMQNGITLIAMATILLPYGAWLPLVLFVSTLPAFFVLMKFNRRNHDWWEETTSDRRWTDYYDLMLTDAEAAEELRLFNLGETFIHAYQRIRARLRGERLALVRDQNLARMGAGISAAVISGVAMVWMVWRAIQGAATLGDLALFYQAFNRGQGLLGALLNNLGQLYTNTLFLGNLFQFLDLESEILDPPRPHPLPEILSDGIEFKNVTFFYPNTDTPAIENFSFKIPAGKSVAIVGPNGAGKSTLIKLLCRFYDPQAGEITLDGVPLQQFRINDLRQMLTVMFQFPVRYHATASENIAISATDREPSAAEIEQAAHASEAHDFIVTLPQKYDTLLGKYFSDGTNISGGEWQRIALARAFVRQAPFIVLDEPTSAMDPWAEAEWLRRFRTLVTEHTALIITHRFTTAMTADIIFVMHDGKIIESGSHAELLAYGGRYAESWAEQTTASKNGTAPKSIEELFS